MWEHTCVSTYLTASFIHDLSISSEFVQSCRNASIRDVVQHVCSLAIPPGQLETITLAQAIDIWARNTSITSATIQRDGTSGTTEVPDLNTAFSPRGSLESATMEPFPSGRSNQQPNASGTAELNAISVVPRTSLDQEEPLAHRSESYSRSNTGADLQVPDTVARASSMHDVPTAQLRTSAAQSFVSKDMGANIKTSHVRGTASERSQDSDPPRAVKNRESAARSRARRQEYKNRLEAEVAALQEQNRTLREMVIRNAQSPNDPHAGVLEGQVLRRTRTMPL